MIFPKLRATFSDRLIAASRQLNALLPIYCMTATIKQSGDTLGRLKDKSRSTAFWLTWGMYLYGIWNQYCINLDWMFHGRIILGGRHHLLLRPLESTYKKHNIWLSLKKVTNQQISSWGSQRKRNESIIIYNSAWAILKILCNTGTVPTKRFNPLVCLLDIYTKESIGGRSFELGSGSRMLHDWIQYLTVAEGWKQTKHNRGT